MKPTPLLPEIAEAFSEFQKPSLYVAEGIYEPERLDYEEMLGGKPRGAIEAADFGPVSWSPLLHLAPDATGYLLPRLVELAESEARDRDGELFLMRLVNFLSMGPTAQEFVLLSPSQRALIAKYLVWLSTERGPLFAEECWDFALEEAIRRWCNDAESLTQPDR
nr:hypothetical protein [uncultured Rhodoferax sp.]